MSVFIIRHAKSVANEENLYGTDKPLSPEGEMQARRSGLKVLIKPDFIFTSTLTRAFQTAKLLYPDAQEIKCLSLFNEINFGELEGKEINPIVDKQITIKPELIKEWYHGDDIWERAKAAKELLDRFEACFEKDVTVVVVLHGTLFEAMLHLVNGGKTKIWDEPDCYLKNCQAFDWSAFIANPEENPAKFKIDSDKIVSFDGGANYEK